MPKVSWPDWLAQAKLKIGNSKQIIHFDEEHFVLQAAIAGQGIALASSAPVTDMVARKVRACLDWLGARFG